MQIVNILAPVLLLVLLGFLLRKFSVFEISFFKNCAKLTYWIGLPALLFMKIAYAEADFGTSWKISLVMMTAIAAVGLIAAVVTRLFTHDHRRRRTFVLTSFYSNTAYVGLPVILYALSIGTGNSKLIDAASMAVAPMIPFVNLLSIIVMGSSREAGKRLAFSGILKILKKIVLNPLIIACVSGLLVSVLDIPLPNLLIRSLDSLGNMALPLALLSIGAGLSFGSLKGTVFPTVTAALFNVFLLPLFGYLFSRYFGLSDSYTLIALIFLACPTAAATFVYAREMDGDHIFAGNVIVLSTLFSTLSLGLVLGLFL
jgi:malate permease and related proteins